MNLNDEANGYEIYVCEVLRCDDVNVYDDLYDVLGFDDVNGNGVEYLVVEYLVDVSTRLDAYLVLFWYPTSGQQTFCRSQLVISGGLRAPLVSGICGSLRMSGAWHATM